MDATTSNPCFWSTFAVAKRLRKSPHTLKYALLEGRFRQDAHTANGDPLFLESNLPAIAAAVGARFKA
jgi:hypothetical protein